MGGRTLLALGAVLAAFLFGAAPGSARLAVATVDVYPSGTSFTASGPTPAHPGAAVSLNMPIGAVDDATILVRGASTVEIQSPTIAAPLSLDVRFAHFVLVNGKPLPDALEAWDGSQHSTEHTNQPLWVQVTVPQGTTPGVYAGSLVVVANGVPATVPISVKVFDVTLPAQNQVSGRFLTAFNVSAQSYGAEVNTLFGVSPEVSIPELYSFIGSYGISPNNWGFGNPSSKSGYTTARDWNKNRAARMMEAVGNPRQFASMWVPLSNNRSTAHEDVAGISPFKPRTWCSYLKSVRGFWQTHGWLNGSFPYTYAMDEPGANLYKTVGEQDTVVHTCFPGASTIITGHPSAKDPSLWNGGKDDVDIWAVLASRYYGERGAKHVTQSLQYIDQARKHGAQIWTYTYGSKSKMTPGFTDTEAVTNPRVFADWAALEGITGMLRGQGATTYSSKENPLKSNSKSDGDFVLIYPGMNGPVPSARLEVFREGIEDWEILNIVRHKDGPKAVVGLLSNLFSTAKGAAELGCVGGCPLKTSTLYSWPTYSHDATTPGKLAAMRFAALTAAAG